jgi:streptogrisin D
LRPKHKQITRTKLTVALAGAAAVVVTATVMLPQAFASRGESPRADENPMARLKSATQTLKQRASVPGTAWAIDPKTKQVVVTADRTVTGAKWDTLMSTVGTMEQGTVRVKRSSGEFHLFAEGGDAIFAGGARCSLGFNVTTQDGTPGILTAGHCTAAGKRWSLSQGGRAVATVVESTFPGDGDFALLTYDDETTAAPSQVDTGDEIVDITEAAEAAVGDRVIRMGSTTGLNDGEVTGLDATVNYPEGTVTGLIQTTVCAEPGDSGGPLFSADGAAIGITSGGSGDCTNGGETFFQPVTTALEAVGATIGDGGAGGGDTGDQNGGGAGDEQDGNEQNGGNQNGRDQEDGQVNRRGGGGGGGGGW